MKLVIVESPAKAKTINKYLGKDFKVVASFGHVRDLPAKNGSVVPEEDFAMKYEVTSSALKPIKAICDSAKDSEQIFLATDPDREGEAISWHIAEVLRQKKALRKETLVKRVAFNEITKKAVLSAIGEPRDIDEHLVNAQQARRALDYLVGFNLSPILWRKLPGSRSAGRVQSVALRLICERETEIENFVTAEYWYIDASFLTQRKEPFTARLSAVGGKKLDKLDIKTEKEAENLVAEIKTRQYTVSSIEKKQQNRNPQPPFTTSSLQQEAARKLGFSTKKTMQLAQKLYEGVEVEGETIGLITYMRTDGVSLSQDAIESTRKLIQKEFGENYLPSQPKLYKAKAKNAQEAHEAIRPTDVSYTPDYLKKFLDKDQHRLYELIWKRMVACQMESAVLDIVTAIIDSTDKKFSLRASGSTIRFDGFYRLYREGKDDSDDEDENKLLPLMNENEEAQLKEVNPSQHFTEPPPRYSEASLVKKLEDLGIGRPSTYASIISVIQDRQYVRLEKKRFIPEERGRVVTAFLSSFFPRYVQYEFTANLENELDDIAEGNLNWKEFLRKFWVDFNGNVGEVSKLRTAEVIDALNELLASHLFPQKEDGSDPRACPSCKAGKLGLRLGKFGAFLACSSYPDCSFTRQIDKDEEVQEIPQEQEDELLGKDPATNQPIYLKKGPYGWYVQLGDKPQEKGAKPKRAALPAGVDPKTLSIEIAIQLLSLPKLIGKHPETGEDILMNIGKFGPYVKHKNKFYSIPKDEDPFSIGINRAVVLIGEAGK
ncbi:MAG: topA [Rickettsiaceae bacterium]|jgi:DNA topoisomerase-1|nr:topA [Rickettsiaceae bacterium]